MPAALTTTAIYALDAFALVTLARIAIGDFLTQKIPNELVLHLLAAGLSLIVLRFAASGDWMPAVLTLSASAAVFVAVIAFWLLGKMGAGDVKLLAIIPMLVGTGGAMPFLFALLALTVLTVLVMKYPLVLPERWFRTYVASLAQSGRVPFGVPIASAAAVAIVISVGSVSAPKPQPAADQAFPQFLSDGFAVE
jgi:prepilin peptidase CpaA